MHYYWIVFNFCMPLLLLHANLSLLEAAERRKIYFTQAVDVYNRKWISNQSVVIGTDQSFMDIYLDLIMDFPMELSADISVAYRNMKNAKFRNIFAYDVNVCQFLGRDSIVGKVSFIYTWSQNFLKYSNMPKSCPILKGTYEWRDLRIEKSSVPSFMVNGEYRGILRTYIRKSDLQRESIGNLTVYGQLK